TSTTRITTATIGIKKFERRMIMFRSSSRGLGEHALPSLFAFSDRFFPKVHGYLAFPHSSASSKQHSYAFHVGISSLTKFVTTANC
ncbi:MAG: hypothetical protein OEW26_03075, partial [Nitrospirota bacterium]|nr:hypothetical protein [Nitrospirota bacterium]